MNHFFYHGLCRLLLSTIICNGCLLILFFPLYCSLNLCCYFFAGVCYKKGSECKRTDLSNHTLVNLQCQVAMTFFFYVPADSEIANTVLAKLQFWIQNSRLTVQMLLPVIVIQSNKLVVTLFRFDDIVAVLSQAYQRRQINQINVKTNPP